MNFETNFLLREIKELLQEKRYKQAISRIQKFVEKDYESVSLHDQIILSILLYQCSALSKLFERNMLKKYKYHSQLIKSLLSLMNRNLNICYRIIEDMIKSTIIFENKLKSPIQINSNSNPSFRKPINQKKTSNGFFAVKMEESKMKVILKKFFKIFQKSCLVIFQTLKIYDFQLDIKIINDLVQMISPLPCKSFQIKILQIKMKIFSAKATFLNSEETKNCIIAEEQINQAIEMLLDLSQELIKKSHPNRREAQSNHAKIIAKHLGTSERLLFISFVIMNKLKFKLGHENLAIIGIHIAKMFANKFDPGASHFKKYITPQIYLQDRFLQYKIEKQQIIELISPCFESFVIKMNVINEQQKKNNSIAHQYNAKMFTFTNNWNQIQVQRNSHSEHLPKSNQSTPIPSNLARKASALMQNILASIIYNNIDQTNQSVQKHQSKKSLIKENKFLKKPVFFTNLNQTTRNKKSQFHQRISSSKKSNSQHKLKDSVEINRTERFQRQESTYNLKLKIEVAKIRTKKCLLQTISSLSKEDNYINSHQIKEQIQQINHKVQTNIMTKIAEKEINVDDPYLKRRVQNMNKKNKSEIFIHILLQNKEFLGIRKIAEKIENIKKKEMEKLKMKSNRLTSSMHREKERCNFHKFQAITKEILRSHVTPKNILQNLEFFQQRKKDECKMMEANFKICQENIEIMKSKLESKRLEKEVEVSKNNQDEFFKMKLKRGANSNFLFSGANTENEIIYSETG